MEGRKGGEQERGGGEEEDGHSEKIPESSLLSSVTLLNRRKFKMIDKV